MLCILANSYTFGKGGGLLLCQYGLSSRKNILEVMGPIPKNSSTLFCKSQVLMLAS